MCVSRMFQVYFREVLRTIKSASKQLRESLQVLLGSFQCAFNFEVVQRKFLGYSMSV